MNSTGIIKPGKWVLAGIPALFFLGSGMHFLYDILGKISAIGAIAPVNESVWEHCKLVLWPVIIWWGIYYFVYGKKLKINPEKWFSGALLALLTGLLIIPLLYYFYTGAFGTELIWVDIAILLIAVTCGQLLGLHVLRHSEGPGLITVFIAFTFIIAVFIIFTFYPPHLPLFQDGPSGNYGIL